MNHVCTVYSICTGMFVCTGKNTSLQICHVGTSYSSAGHYYTWVGQTIYRYIIIYNLDFIDVGQNVWWYPLCIQTIRQDGSGWMSMYCTTDILRLDTGFCSTVLNLNGNYQNIIYHILYVLSLCTCNQLASSILCTVFASTMSAVCVSVQTMFFVDLFGKKTLYLIIATNGMRIKNYL